MLLTTACAGVSDLDMSQTDVKDPHTVTLTVQSEMGAMRAATDAGTGATGPIVLPHIGDGTKADLLIFAVYKKGENGETTVDKRFAKGNQSKYFDLTLSEGQSAIDVESYPLTLQFVIEDDAEYQVAFWGQNGGKAGVYDTQKLEEVKVIYNNVDNNDELRDAFCAVSEPFSATKQPNTVTLRRPLAQINVGTSGWDYEGAAYLKPSRTSFVESIFELQGVAQYYNVVTGKAIVDNTHPTTNVTFKEGRIPAFINVTQEQWDTLSYLPFANEEYLQVKRDDNTNAYAPYIGWEEFDKYRLGEDTKELYEKGEVPFTEVFKYLSMCYVLVPENTAANGEPTKSVLESVNFTFKGIKANDNDKFEGNAEEALQKDFTVLKVPVQKNWRTNIIGNSFFIDHTKFHLDVVPDFMGDYKYDGSVYGDPSKGEDWPEEGSVHEAWFSNTHNSGSSAGTAETGNGFFSFGTKHEHASGKYVISYGGQSYNYTLKMQGDTEITFTTETNAIVTVVQSHKQTTANNGAYPPSKSIKIITKQDGKEDIETKPSGNDTQINESDNFRVHTLSVGVGTHTIKTDSSGITGENEGGLLYIKVQTQTDIKDDTWDKNEGFEYE